MASCTPWLVAASLAFEAPLTLYYEGTRDCIRTTLDLIAPAKAPFLCKSPRAMDLVVSLSQGHQAFSALCLDT